MISAVGERQRVTSHAARPRLFPSAFEPLLSVSLRPATSEYRFRNEKLRLTIVYEQGDDGWIVASVPEVPGALSQGQTRGEARENVIAALRGILELRFGEHALSDPAADSESLELVIAA